MTEEETREVVRSELLLLSSKMRPEEKKGLWHFVNSSFGLWLLSSIVLGGLTLVYTTISTAKRSAKEKEERLERLDAEVDLRFRRVLSAIQALWNSRVEREYRRTNGLAPLTIDLGPNALTTNDTRLLFNRPMADEVFQIEFANYTVKSLLAEGYYLSRSALEQRAIRAALEELEKAREFERVAILLEKGIVPPGYSAGSYSSDEEITIRYGTREALEHDLLKMLSSQQKGNHGFKSFEDHIQKAFDYWQRRRTIKESELPKQPSDKSNPTKPPL